MRFFFTFDDMQKSKTEKKMKIETTSSPKKLANGGNFKCDVCQKNFKYERALISHRKSIDHVIKTKRFNGDDSGTSFLNHLL